MNLDEIKEKYMIDTNYKILKAAKNSSSGKEKQMYTKKLDELLSGTSRAEIIRRDAEHTRERINGKGGERIQRERELLKLSSALAKLRTIYSSLNRAKNLNIVEWCSDLGSVIEKGEKVERVTRKAIENTTNY